MKNEIIKSIEKRKTVVTGMNQAVIIEKAASVSGAYTNQSTSIQSTNGIIGGSCSQSVSGSYNGGNHIV
jgi:hypothetical protein